MDIPLSPVEVQQIAGCKIKLVKIADLIKVESIYDLFSDCNKVLILYLSKKHFGHYSCLSYVNNTVTFFDSYGMFPDEQLKNINKHFRKVSKQLRPQIIRLLLTTVGPMQYNEKKLQGNGENIMTCGRWCGFYLRTCEIVSLEEFTDMFAPYKKKDRLITSITDEFLF